MCLGDVVGVGLKTGCDGGSGCGKCRGVSGEREGRVSARERSGVGFGMGGGRWRPWVWSETSQAWRTRLP